MKKVLWFVVFLALVPFGIKAATINVPGDYLSVYEAWDHVVSGDTIKIAPGDYTEPEGWGTWTHHHMVAGVTVEGSGWWNTRVNITSSGSHGYTAIIANEPDCVFRNFHLWTNWATNLIDIYATGVVFDRMVLRPTASGIVFVAGTNPTLTNLIIDSGDGSGWEAAILGDTEATIYNCLLMNGDSGLYGFCR